MFLSGGQRDSTNNDDEEEEGNDESVPIIWATMIVNVTTQINPALDIPAFYLRIMFTELISSFILGASGGNYDQSCGVILSCHVRLQRI